MLFKKEKPKYWIIDYSFLIYNSSFGQKSPCSCSRVELDGKLHGREDCTKCEGTGWAYLASRSGFRTGGIYGVLNQILKAIDSDYKPILVFDPPKENLDRTALLDSYKGNRKECPEWIRMQMEWGEQYLQYIPSIDCYTSNNHESDDVMATLALEYADKGYEVIIAADDKDFFPLLEHKLIRMYRQKNIFTKKDFFAKFGFEPNRFTDYLTIVGDAADNYNLIKGLGDKSAKDIIANYKDLDAMVNDSWRKLSPRTKNWINKIVSDVGLEKFKSELKRSFQLAQLNTKVDYTLLKPKPNKELIVRHLKEMELKVALGNIALLFEEYE